MRKRLWLSGVSGGFFVFLSFVLCPWCVEVPDCVCECFVRVCVLGSGV